MPQFQTDVLTPEQRSDLLTSPTKGFTDRAPYREALRALTNGEVLRIRPNLDEESSRAVKFRINGAAKDVGVAVKYGDSKSGEILVWLAEDVATVNGAGAPGSRRRGSAPASETPSVDA